MVSFSVKTVLEWCGGEVVNAASLGSYLDEIRVTQPSSLAKSKPTDLSFFFSRAFQHELPMAQPGILVVGVPFVEPLKAAQLPFWNRCAVIACRDPYFAMALISEKFAEVLSTVTHPVSADLGSPEVHASAVVSPLAKLGEGVKIGPNCVVEKYAVIGKGTYLYPGCYIGPSAQVGENCVFFPGVTVYERVEIGNRVRIHARTVIGADGFGYAPEVKNGQVSGHRKIYHLGRVVIGDDVEIGANSSVDRGTLGDTRIASHVKLDNLVHVAHNCSLDEGAIMCGASCLAGSASVGKYAYIGGMVGVADHVRVGDRSSVGAMSLVSKDVAPGTAVVGNPQRSQREHFRAHALLSKLLAERERKLKT